MIPLAGAIKVPLRAAAKTTKPLLLPSAYFFSLSFNLPRPTKMGVAASKVTNTARSRASNSLEEKTQQRPSSSSSLPTSQHPTSPQGTVSLAVLDSWETELAQNPNVLLARTVLPHTGLKAALASRAAVRDVPHVFSHTLERTTAPVTDQKSSGRCWLFATTNVARYEVTKRLRLKEFQFSQVMWPVPDRPGSC